MVHLRHLHRAQIVALIFVHVQGTTQILGMRHSSDPSVMTWGVPMSPTRLCIEENCTHQLPEMSVLELSAALADQSGPPELRI